MSVCETLCSLGAGGGNGIVGEREWYVDRTSVLLGRYSGGEAGEVAKLLGFGLNWRLF